CFMLASEDMSSSTAVGAGVSTWRGGGPAGATWNAARLTCAAEFSTTCKAGTITAELRIGKAVVASHVVPISAGVASWSTQLKPKQWEKNLDDVASAKRALFRTAVFRITANLSCHSPYEAGPGIGPRNEVAADRMFVAGFAHGE
ncbi:MAG: hypothetical protein JWN04_1367, partial [Myxococcaceae bacterium]|nr:hypothetical protein [Myxococcaceae bacterium]